MAKHTKIKISTRGEREEVTNTYMHTLLPMMNSPRLMPPCARPEDKVSRTESCLEALFAHCFRGVWSGEHVERGDNTIDSDVASMLLLGHWDQVHLRFERLTSKAFNDCLILVVPNEPLHWKFLLVSCIRPAEQVRLLASHLKRPELSPECILVEFHTATLGAKNCSTRQA